MVLLGARNLGGHTRGVHTLLRSRNLCASPAQTKGHQTAQRNWRRAMEGTDRDHEPIHRKDRTLELYPAIPTFIL